MKKVLSVLLGAMLMIQLFSGGVVADAADPLPSYNGEEAWSNPDAPEWSYYVRNVSDGTMTKLERDASSGQYRGGAANYVASTWQSTGENGALWSVREFTAPYTGIIRITMQGNAVEKNNWATGGAVSSAAFAKIAKNYTDEKWYTDFAGGTDGNYGFGVGFEALTVEVKAGDHIAFMTWANDGVNSGVWFAPIITYTNITPEEGMPSYVAADAWADPETPEWSYYVRNVTNGTMTEMERNANGMYLGGSNNFVNDTWQSTGGNPALWSIREFTAPYTGTIQITMKDNVVAMNNWTGVSGGNPAVTFAKIARNYSDEKWFTDFSSGTDNPTGYGREIGFEALTFEVKEGDHIAFMTGANDGVNSGVWFAPTITYTSISQEQEELPSYVAEEAWANPGAVEWFYLVRNITNGTMTEMERNGNGMYLGGSANYVNDTWQSTGTDGALWSIREFTAPYSGTIKITMKDDVVRMTDWSGQVGTPVQTYAKVAKNYADVRWEADFANGKDLLSGQGIEVAFETLTMEVQEGDKVAFMTGTDCGTSTYVWFAPTIQYTSLVADNYYDVSNYRKAGSAYDYPTKEGCVFAGWYTDKAFTTPLGADVTTGKAYAKFVDANVLSVKGQLTAGTTEESLNTNLRLLTTVDALQYQTVGFEIEVEGKTMTATTRTVYQTVKGYVDEEEKSYLPTEFSKDSKYFMTFRLTNIPSTDYDKIITVTPMWTTLDGTTITGKVRSFTIREAFRSN